MDLEYNPLINEFYNLSSKDVDFEKKCAKIVQDILNGDLAILKLVEHLKPLLLDPSPNQRELGIEILNHILNGLPLNYLSVDATNLIATFYADKLHDHHQVIPSVLQGIIVLLKCNRLHEGTPTQLLKQLFQHVPCQQQQQPERQKIYIIIEQLFNQHKTELCSMDLDLVYGVISAVDGERDPRNLLFLFKWFPHLLQNVKLGHLSEEMFEVLACYFPIDFRAPPQQSNNISRQDLSESLCSCLCAIPEFANYCLPLSLEKLDSSLQISKLDSLKLLKEGCKTFDMSSYLQHANEIWSEIQKNVFTSTDNEIKSECLETLSNVMRKLSESDEQTYSKLLKDITETVKGNLLPDSEFFELSVLFLTLIASSSEYSSKFMANEIVPILTNTYSITTDPTFMCKILSSSIGFVKAYYSYNQKENEAINVIPILCLEALLNKNIIVITSGFDNLSSIADYVLPAIRGAVYKNLQKYLISPVDLGIEKSVLNCFETFAIKYSEEVQTNIINNIIVPDLFALDSYLKALLSIANQEYFTDFITSYLLEESLKDVNRTSLVLTHMRNLLENSNGRLQTVFYSKSIINKLIQWTINKIDKISYNLLTDIGFILKLIVGSQTVEVQKLILKNHLSYILNQLKDNFKLIFLLDGLLCRIYRDVELDFQILDNLLAIIKIEPDCVIRNVSSMLLANLLNKCSNEDVLEKYLNKYETENSQEDIETISYITKALIMRNYYKSEYWTDKLLNILETNAEGSNGLRIVMNDSLDSLNSKSNCITSILYRQKFFILVSNKLNEKYKPEKFTYLKAFGYLMEFAPKPAILLQFNKILKLFIICLEQSNDCEVLSILLQTLKNFIIKKEKSIEDHLEEFLTRLVDLSLNNFYMKVRILSLECIQLYPSSFPLYKLLPLKNDVVIKLGKCLDDKKRFVRKEAVRARSLWYLLDFQPD